MARVGGVKVLDEREGHGRPAQKGDCVLFNMRLYLNRGEEVPLNQTQAEYLPQEMIRIVDSKKLIDRTVTLGRREVIAGVEQTLMGMKPGGYRKVRISPHLAYREKGIPDLIPPDAVLVVELWLRALLEERTVPA